MQTTAQNYLSKHGEWKFITLAVVSLNILTGTSQLNLRVQWWGNVVI